jgi:hypothetical protein
MTAKPKDVTFSLELKRLRFDAPTLLKMTALCATGFENLEACSTQDKEPTVDSQSGVLHRAGHSGQMVMQQGAETLRTTTPRHCVHPQSHELVVWRGASYRSFSVRSLPFFSARKPLGVMPVLDPLGCHLPCLGPVVVSINYRI